MSTTLDQRRATDAWNVICTLKEQQDATQPKRVQRAAKQLPVRIMTAGLGHALLFVLAKGKASDLLTALSQWVCFKRYRKSPEPKEPNKSEKLPHIIQGIKDGSADDLRRYTAETIAWLAWFNRFAEAEFGAVDMAGDDE